MKTLLLLLFPVLCFGQNDSCQSASPYPTIIPHCFFFPYQKQAQYCVTFTSIQDTLYSDFSFVASCTQLDRTYYLYDSNCNFLDSNINGKFYTPTGNQFIICCKLNCISGLGINGICLTTSLPVTFLYVYLSGSTLHWATGSEHNSDYFEILGANNLELKYIGRVDAAGNSTSTRYYRFEVEPYDYYRVAAVDYDGLRTYSDIISTHLKEEEIQFYSLQGVPLEKPQGIYIIKKNNKYYLAK